MVQRAQAAGNAPPAPDWVNHPIMQYLRSRDFNPIEMSPMDAVSAGARYLFGDRPFPVERREKYLANKEYQEKQQELERLQALRRQMIDNNPVLQSRQQWQQMLQERAQPDRPPWDLAPPTPDVAMQQWHRTNPRRYFDATGQ
jgi:hypothetical protein